jgi:hypothetical protein
MKDWLNTWGDNARAEIAKGNVAFVQRRLVPFVAFVGLSLGVLIALLSSFVACLVLIAFGFLVGYAARSYVSYRRRMAYLNRRGLSPEI